ncbi:MAG: hypothetical protein HY000_05285 [Planctomycetes bacterium]|nr:hypothetical protein [Planctomycetota bacterium]
MPAKPPTPSPAEQPIDIGSRLELFVDDYLIDRMTGTRLVLHPPRRAERVLDFDAPWEGRDSAYVTVFQDGPRYRMYYRGLPGEGKQEVTCYAESPDGIHWTKPSLGLFEYNGSKDNNIVWTGFGTHNFAPFKDANRRASAEERYKALAGGPLVALVSPDGIHWKKLREQPVLTKGAFDSQNLAFWDAERGCYAAYFRIFIDGVRGIARATSDDFIHWSDPEPIDTGDAPREHFYTNATTPYSRAPHLLLSFPKRFVPSRKRVPDEKDDGVSDGVFMTSRDGRRFQRQFLEAFLRPGRDLANWTDRNNMIAWGVVPTAPDEISIYFSQHYDHPDSHLRRGVLRTDGFVSVRAPYAGGELVTKPLLFRGRKLVLNYATSAAGSVQVELLDATGKTLPGFALADCPEIYGDEIEGIVGWKSGSDVSSLAGKPLRLRLVLRDADVYSMRFAE